MSDPDNSKRERAGLKIASHGREKNFFAVAISEAISERQLPGGNVCYRRDTLP